MSGSEASGIKSIVHSVVNPRFDQHDADISELKSGLRDLKVEVRHLGVRFEDFDHKLDAIAELFSTTIQTRSDVDRLKSDVQAIRMDVDLLKTNRKKS